jgi:hypothetical protein
MSEVKWLHFLEWVNWSERCWGEIETRGSRDLRVSKEIRWDIEYGMKCEDMLVGSRKGCLYA